MSSWEKWVFPQEVNAFPSPSFFSRSPSPCSLQSYSPSNLFIRSERPPTSHPIFQALPGTRQNNAPRGNSCITCVKLCEPWKERRWRRGTGRAEIAEELVFISICLTLNTDGGYLIADSCSQPRRVHRRLNLHGFSDRKWCPQSNFSFLRRQCCPAGLR